MVVRVFFSFDKNFIQQFMQNLGLQIFRFQVTLMSPTFPLD